METGDKIIIKLVVAFILVWAYLLIPESEVLHYPFKFDPQGITWQAYYDYLFTRIAIILMVWCVFDLAAKYREYVFVFLILWVGYLFDYLICYNQPYAWFVFKFVILFSIPICYGLFAGLSMIGILLYKVLKK